jgi:hypothetical protein
LRLDTLDEYGHPAVPLADTNLCLPTLQYSILRNASPTSTSDTKYGATLYAIVHEDAVRCEGPDGTEYDRVKVLQELGYHVNIVGSPFGPAQIADSDLRAKLDHSAFRKLISADSDLGENIDDSAFRELIRLFAFDYTWHRMVGKFPKPHFWALLSVFCYTKLT